MNPNSSSEHSSEEPLQRSAHLEALYKRLFPAVAAYVSKRGGTLDEAKDIFQEAVIIAYEKVRNGDVELHNEQAYIMGTAKHFWLKQYRQQSQQQPLSAHHDADNATTDTVSSGRLLRFLETAGHKCMELLRAFYYDGLSMTEIAHNHGFSGERSATVQKYKCLEKVRNTVKQKSLQYEDFLD